MRAPLLMAGLCLAACAGPGADDSVVRVYNWTDYIGPDTVEQFENDTGVRVVYDVFDSNEVLEAKLLTGASGYDIVVPTSDFMGRQITAGVFRPLDKSQLENYGNLDPELMQFLESFDPGNRYGVPYFWGTTGIGYNRDRVAERLGPDAPVDSFDMLFRPRYLSRLADCGVAFLDAPQEAFAAILNYLGHDPNTTDLDKYRVDARRVLEDIRPYISYFHSSQYINDLANGEVCVVFGWSGDILQARDRAREAENGVRIEYSIPREGALMWFDMLAIPVDAKNVVNAHRFIDYLLRPDVIARITAYVKYANANRAAREFLDPAIRDNRDIYPGPAVRQTLFTGEVTGPQVDRVMNRVWTAIKTGY